MSPWVPGACSSEYLRKRYLSESCSRQTAKIIPGLSVTGREDGRSVRMNGCDGVSAVVKKRSTRSRTLGGKPDCARFLNLPDLGTTDLLMRGDPELSVLISDNIQEWEPTVALIPTMLDAHPDHSALSVAFSMALDSVGGSSIRAWEYLVHKPHVPIRHEPVKLPLSAEEVARKRRAILCHETQVALSRGRFTGFARIEEAYYPHHPIEAKTCDEPLAAARLHEGVLSLQFKVSRAREIPFGNIVRLSVRYGKRTSLEVAGSLSIR